MDVHFQLESAQCAKFKKQVETLLDYDPKIFEGDVLNVTYKSQIEYWSDLTKKLVALNKMLADPSVKLKSANLKDLKHGLQTLQDAITNINKTRELLIELDQLRRIERRVN